MSQTCTYDASSNEHVTVKVNASNLVSWEVYETELLGDYFCYYYFHNPLNVVKPFGRLKLLKLIKYIYWYVEINQLWLISIIKLNRELSYKV